MAGAGKNQIVMINSFKGGAGKTTAALCRCVTEYKEKRNCNIYYIDMDVLGTGVSYIFDLKDQRVYYNDVDDCDKQNIFNNAFIYLFYCVFPQNIEKLPYLSDNFHFNLLVQ